MKPEEIVHLRLQNEINIAFDDHLKQQEKNWKKFNFGFDGIPDDEIVRRLSQIYVKENFSRFNQQYADGQKNYQEEADLKKAIKNYFSFLGYLIKFSALGVWQLVLSRKKFGNTNCLFDVHGFDKLFKSELVKSKHFFNAGPIKFFNDSDFILITSNDKFSGDKFCFIKNPWLELLRHKNLSLFDSLFLISQSIGLMIKFSWIMLRFPVLNKLFRDFGFFPLVELVNRAKILKFYAFTNTLADEQNLAINFCHERTFSTHFVSYSVNSKPMKYTYHEGKEFAEFPYFRNIIVDHAWTWDEDQANWLKSFNPHIKTHVVGPILFYLPEFERTVHKTNEASIAFFDVTPFSDAHIKKGLGWHGYNYYNAPNAIQLLQDLIEVFPQHKVVLKPKRNYIAEHDQNYVKLVMSLKNEKKLELLPTDLNIFQMIADSDLVITTPYSSPALIAPSLGKKAIYYDPTGFVVCNYQLPEGVYFCSGKNELKSLVERLLHSR